MSTAGTIIRGEGEGERLWFAGGGLWTMKATSEETNGAFFLWENQMAQGKTTPLHTHPNVDEALIVLEGRSWSTPKGASIGLARGVLR